MISGYDHDAMKRKSDPTKGKVGVGKARIKAIVKELRKEYGLMLKRLADYGEQSSKT
jgi:hypothetical protein